MSVSVAGHMWLKYVVSDKWWWCMCKNQPLNKALAKWLAAAAEAASFGSIFGSHMSGGDTSVLDGDGRCLLLPCDDLLVAFALAGFVLTVPVGCC